MTVAEAGVAGAGCVAGVAGEAGEVGGGARGGAMPRGWDRLCTERILYSGCGKRSTHAVGALWEGDLGARVPGRDAGVPEVRGWG